MFRNETTMRKWNGTHINEFMNLTFGFSPFRQEDNSVYVPWIDIIIAVISIFLICSFPGQSAGLCGLVVGGFDSFAGAFITGINPTIAVLGVVIFIWSLLYMWSKRE